VHLPSERDLAIEDALRGTADQFERSGDGGWRLVVAGGARTVLHARIVDDDWLVADLYRAWSARSWWPLLQLNAGLDGCVRLTSAQGRGLEVRGEIFIDGEVPASARDQPSLLERVAGMCCDVVSAGRQIVGLRADESNATDSLTPADPEALMRVCRDAGWEARALDSGRVQVTLDTRSTQCRATLSFSAGGRLHAVAPLTTSPSLSPESQDAIARALLAASAQLRMVRGLAMHHDGGELAGLSFAGERHEATAATIDCALAALSVACRAVELEVQALESADLAREYLTIRGVYPANAVSPTTSFEQEDMPCLQLP